MADEIFGLGFGLRFTGLRIREHQALNKHGSATSGCSFMRKRQKTPVLLPLHKDAQEALAASGNGNPKTVVGDWQRTLRKLFAIGGIENEHAHRFRDSFAVDLLLKGVSLENVATLLGNTIRVAEKH